MPVWHCSARFWCGYTNAVLMIKNIYSAVSPWDLLVLQNSLLSLVTWENGGIWHIKSICVVFTHYTRFKDEILVYSVQMESAFRFLCYFDILFMIQFSTNWSYLFFRVRPKLS